MINILKTIRMNNNEFFCWSRFVAHFKKLCTDRRRSWLIYAATLWAGILLFLLYFSIRAYSFGIQTLGAFGMYATSTRDPIYLLETTCFMLLLIVVACLSASQFLHDARRKSGRIAMLMQPVSTFENWLARWVIYVLLCLVMYAVCFGMADLIRWAVLAPIYPHVPITLLWTQLDTFTSHDVLLYLSLYTVFSSFFLLGGVFFPRRPLLISSVLLFFTACYFLGVATIFNAFFHTYFNSSDDTGKFPIAMVSLGLMLCSWYLSYLRLKELEIVDRM